MHVERFSQSPVREAAGTNHLRGVIEASSSRDEMPSFFAVLSDQPLLLGSNLSIDSPLMAVKANNCFGAVAASSSFRR